LLDCLIFACIAAKLTRTPLFHLSTTGKDPEEVDVEEAEQAVVV